MPGTGIAHRSGKARIYTEEEARLKFGADQLKEIKPWYIVPKLRPMWTTKHTHVVTWGGRGGAKSMGIGDFMLAKCMSNMRINALSCREYQNSIDDSNHEVLVERIYHYNLEKYWEITKTELRYRPTGSKIKFAGLKNNPGKHLSKQNIRQIHMEEGSFFSLESIRLLVPTVTRNKGLQIVWSFNPRYATDPVYQMFLASDEERLDGFPYDRRPYIDENGNTVHQAEIIELHWNDNPYITKERNPEWFEEMAILQRTDQEEYDHVYNGKLWKRSDATIFLEGSHWNVKSTEDANIPETATTHLGADYGNHDPNVLLEAKVWDRRIHITREFYKNRLSPAQIADAYATFESARDGVPIIADSSLGGINMKYLAKIHPKYTFNLRPAIKGADSVANGIRFLKGYDITVDPSCRNTIRELRSYKYIIDKTTEIVRDKPDEKTGDHCPDALRYLMEPMMRRALGKRTAMAGSII